jgi:fatty acid desaturase/predicted heme/steroid binding protein
MPATPLTPPVVNNGATLKQYTWEDISKHNSLKDCWIVVSGKVYDVTTWVPKHPGGDLIRLAAGREATALVYSYHPPSVFAVLPKYCVGEVKDYENFYTFESAFYSTMKGRVAAYMQQHQLSRSVWQLYAKSLLLLALYTLSYRAAFIQGHFIATVILGFFHAQMGINIMHDGNHGAYSDNKFICNLAGLVMDLIGSSRVVWWHQHNVGHHPNSNTSQLQKLKAKLDPLAFDPDASAGNPFVRLNPSQPHRWFHQYQHIYLWFMIMFINFKWFVNDIRAMAKRRYMDIEFGGASEDQLKSLLVTKSIFLLYALCVPVYLHGLYGALLFVTFMVATGYVFVLMFSVNHLTAGCTFPDGKLAYDKRDWAVLQVMTASNFANQSFFWTMVSGGLNFQIEHHLFPGINHMHLPLISPIVQETCKEFGVQYKAFPSFWSAVYSYYSHLKALGNPTLHEKKLK